MFSMLIVDSIHGCTCNSLTCDYLGWEISDDICQVTTPEGRYTLFLCDTCKAVHDTTVTLDFSTANTGIGILCLDDQLNTLDGSCASLCNGTGHTTYLDRYIWYKNHRGTIGKTKRKDPYYYSTHSHQ